MLTTLLARSAYRSVLRDSHATARSGLTCAFEVKCEVVKCEVVKCEVVKC